MADRPPPPRPSHSGSLFHRRIHPNGPASLQLLGLLTLLLTGAVLLFLTGVTVAVAFLGLIFFSPLIILLSPIWLPIAALLFFAVAGFLFLCGTALAAAAGGYWLYRYFRGQHPIGSERVDYATSRIVSTASHVRDYAREYGGGYFHGKVKDAAPGA